MGEERPSTPPREQAAGGELPPPPLTPEQLRRIEINRMKAKAIREQREKEAAAASAANQTTGGVKRSFSAMAAETPASQRDARTNNNRPLEKIRPARNFTKYVDYDFSKMTDTKGGFLTEEDDPHNKALHTREEQKEKKPAHMTQKEWERHQLLKAMEKEKVGPFEPGLSVLDDKEQQKKCRECGSLAIDWKWEEAFKCCVCHACKEKYPEKYSLLTKTEAKEDYLLTDPELRDQELLPHMKKPNPHKATWNDMMLYLRYQVEEYAFSPKKWGSPEALDAEFERREAEKKRRREVKFKTKLEDLKKRTRAEQYRRSRQGLAGGNFGDIIGKTKHEHQWGRGVENPETGMTIKKCVECGMEVEELEL
ncbi:hypothetical protein VTN49DRAFT_7536 [Thermomyces lanuginosus]|uniref:uncharacterized protein n=1 Tax=Thermomyces lanuginosus TaxID=5541 RepID=UPI003743DBEE